MNPERVLERLRAMTDQAATMERDQIHHELTALRADISQITQDVARTNASVQSLVDIAKRHDAELTDLQREDRNRRNAPWALLIGMAGILSGFVVLHTRPIEKSLDTLSANVVADSRLVRDEAMRASSLAATTRERLEHALQEGEANAEAIRDMDTVVQREMRILDEILQREMRLIAERQGTDLSWLREQVADLRQRDGESIKDRAELRAWVEALREDARDGG